MTANESAPDPTAGEREHNANGDEHLPVSTTTPPADDASECEDGVFGSQDIANALGGRGPDDASEPVTEADVSALVGDDIDYWLGNPFMTPDLIADKVRWWVTTAATKARADETRIARGGGR